MSKGQKMYGLTADRPSIPIIKRASGKSFTSVNVVARGGRGATIGLHLN